MLPTAVFLVAVLWLSGDQCNISGLSISPQQPFTLATHIEWTYVVVSHVHRHAMQQTITSFSHGNQSVSK